MYVKIKMVLALPLASPNLLLKVQEKYFVFVQHVAKYFNHVESLNPKLIFSL